MRTTMPLAIKALVLSPAAIPPGGTVAVTGTGFAPNAPLELFLLIPQFHDARVKMADLVASAAGDFATTVRLNNFTTPPRAPWPSPAVGPTWRGPPSP